MGYTIEVDKQTYFDLPPRAVYALRKKGIRTAQDLSQIPSEEYLINIKGIGKTAIKYIKREYKKLFNEELFQRASLKYSSETLGKDLSDKSKILILTSSQAEKMILANTLYVKFGTLQSVATSLNVTRERVRQLLERGDSLGLFEYQLSRTIRFKELTDKVSKEKIVQEIKNNKTTEEICSALNIGVFDYFRLIKFYDIDVVDYRFNSKRKLIINKYMEIVDRLGHHPTTTEMNSYPPWRNLWLKISRSWGSMKIFRNEYGIEKPAMNIHPNTLKSWAELYEKRILGKQTKIKTLKEYLNNHESTSNQIVKDLAFSVPTVRNYLQELKKSGSIKVRRLGRKLFYSLHDE